MFAKYQITTFCAPPTMYRMLIKQDLSRFDLSSIQHASIAGEALNPEVFRQFEKATGMRIMEGFGQSESTLIIGNLAGDSHKIGSMGKPVPLYDVHLLDSSGHEAEAGDTGEICINIQNGIPCGLAYEYYNSPEGAFITQGCIVDGLVKNSVLFTGAKVAPGAKIIDSVLMPGVEVEEGAVVTRALVADHVKIGKNAIVGSADSENIELVAKRVKGEE